MRVCIRVCACARVGKGCIGEERKNRLIFKNVQLTASQELRTGQALPPCGEIPFLDSNERVS